MKIYSDAEQFIKDTFWKDSHDKTGLNLVQDFYDKIRNEITNKDPDYYAQQNGIIHVSSLTSCLRGQIHLLLGHTPDREPEDRKIGVYWVGTQFEEAIIDRLGDKVTGRQTQYEYKYKSLTLRGRSDFRIMDGAIERIGEIKTVHSDAFWYRAKEGNVVAWNNLVQLQIYLWLERVLFNKKPEGIFVYASKDDVTLEQAPIKFNQQIIDEIVIPTLDILNEAYEKKDPLIAPVPPMAVWSDAKHQYQINWLAKYCDFHNQCVGSGWILEAQDTVARKNKELKEKISGELTAHTVKRSKPDIKVVE